MNNDFLNSLCCPRFCSYHFPPSDVSFSAWNVLILCAPSDQTHITGEGYVLLCELVHSGTKALQLQEMAEVLLCRNCSPALWVRICSYIPYYEYTDELHTGVQKEIKCNFLKFFCARACPMGSDHAPNWWDLMPSQEQNQLPRVILIETNIGWTLALFMKQANELLWAFCHCWDSLQCTRAFIAVDTGAVIKACAQSGKSPHTVWKNILHCQAFGNLQLTMKKYQMWGLSLHQSGLKTPLTFDYESSELACYIWPKIMWPQNHRII